MNCTGFCSVHACRGAQIPQGWDAPGSPQSPRRRVASEMTKGASRWVGTSARRVKKCSAALRVDPPPCGSPHNRAKWIIMLIFLTWETEAQRRQATRLRSHRDGGRASTPPPPSAAPSRSFCTATATPLFHQHLLSSSLLPFLSFLWA